VKKITTTPLLEYLKLRKQEKQRLRDEKREERRRRDMERRRTKDDPVISKVRLSSLHQMATNTVRNNIWDDNYFVRNYLLNSIEIFSHCIFHSLLYLLIPNIFVYSVHIIRKTISHSTFPYLIPQMSNMKIFNAFSKIQVCINTVRSFFSIDLYTNERMRNCINLIRDFTNTLKRQNRSEV